MEFGVQDNYEVSTSVKGRRRKQNWDQGEVKLPFRLDKVSNPRWSCGESIALRVAPAPTQIPGPLHVF